MVLTRRVGAVVFVLLMSLLLAVAWGVRARLSPEPLRELAIAVGPGLPLGPRLTGGFQPGKSFAQRGGAATVAVPLTPDARIAIARIEKAAARSSDQQLALGVAYLVQGDIERSVTTLEEASHQVADDAQVLANLAAAYLVRSQEASHFDDAAKAVSVAQQAVQLDPSGLEAQFNLALSLETLNLPGEARKAWERYLESDRSSEWSREAQRHLERLKPSQWARHWDDERQAITERVQRGDAVALAVTARQVPDTVAQYVEDNLLPEWAAALQSGSPEAPAIARRARLLADALATAVGERVPADAVACIERAIASGDARAVQALAAAHQTFASARALYRRDRFAESATLFEQAYPALARAGSPFADWSTYFLATAAYYRGDLPATVAPLDSLIVSAQRRQYFTLSGRALRLRGLIASLRGDVDRSLADYQAALAAFDRVGAQDDVSAIHSVISQRLEAIGDYRSAWAHRQRALDGLPSVRYPQTILLSTATLAKRQNFLHAALALQNEALSAVTRSGSSVDFVEAHLSRADVHRLLGHLDRANADVDEAARYAATIADAGVARRFRAEAALAKGELADKSASASALQSLTESLGYFQEAGMQQRLARVYQAMGRVYSETGQVDAAEASFGSGIAILERQRSRLPNGAPRLSYFDLPWNLFEDMVALLSARPDTERRALVYAERSRARDLAETMREASDGAPIDPARLAAQLPAGTVVVYYALLRHELLSWLIQPGAVTLFREPVEASAIEADVARFRAAIDRQLSSETERLSQALYARLMARLSAAIPRQATVVIVPDGVLHAVPFAALRDARTRRYLIEDHPIAVAPSATLLAHARQRASSLAPATTSTVLVVGNPLIDPEDARGLPDLSGAEGEAAAIAARYRHASVLTGARATKAAFLDSAGQFGIVHFAGHAIANESYPLLSRMLFAKDAQGHSGVLFANEVLSMNLTSTSLVVLAACRTAVGPIKRGEGVIGLARPFLAGGVPSVVATLWDIDDRASQAMFESFYAELGRTASPSGALRAAQLALLRNADQRLNAPSAWAGFVVNGGGN